MGNFIVPTHYENNLKPLVEFQLFKTCPKMTDEAISVKAFGQKAFK